MKIGGEYGSVSKRIARVHFLESLEKIRPDIIDKLNNLITKAKELHESIILKLKGKREDIKSEKELVNKKN